MSTPAVLLDGRYRLAERVATGGMGEVWRAEDEVLNRTVAVKLLRPELAESADALARFRAEARHTAGLTHPGIAQVYDYGEPEPPAAPFLIMEFVDGPPLSRLLDAGPLGPATVMDLVAQAADGLAAAHEAGLVHRDIKPGNLLVTADGTVKITDFGIASAAWLAPITRTGTLVGTPAYLAPERVAGATATPASDLYSLGVVAYECLAARPPFSGSPMEVALAHRHLSPPPLPRNLPPAVTGLVAELTAKDPAGRPPTASAAADRARQIRAALIGPPAVAFGGEGHDGGDGPGAGAAEARTLHLGLSDVGGLSYAGNPALDAEPQDYPRHSPGGPAGQWQPGDSAGPATRATWAEWADRLPGGRPSGRRLAVLAAGCLIVVIGVVLAAQLAGGSGGRPAAACTGTGRPRWSAWTAPRWSASQNARSLISCGTRACRCGWSGSQPTGSRATDSKVMPSTATASRGRCCRCSRPARSRSAARSW